MKLRNKISAALLTLILAFSLGACQTADKAGSSADKAAKTESQRSSGTSRKNVSIDNIPEYSDQMYVEVNSNRPDFSSKDLKSKSYESYSKLDSLGRCGTAEANIGKDIMPTKKRGAIGMVKPTGWHTVKYSNVDGKYLYNRCHLIGYQLTGENANKKNLITGTRAMNVDGMLPFEDMVADYVKETGNHVLYRVTPVYEGKDLVARGVQMEAMSVEDKGKSVEFNVFVYNVQPGISIDYKTGQSTKSQSQNTSSTKQKNTSNYVCGNSRSKVYHCPGQRDYEKMKTSKYLVKFKGEKEAQEAGYRKAKR
ncbi:DNA/RNA non-specific endonuclease [Anaerostipes sp.]|uniref:DNA/RNA non-specific endonuclease n=1 Tax=Anaerostipes sp. TaxID=1872530 RepID=UPI0025C6CB31|nr:DNA/RNA non-specific endonuclease [Anaerostipes sp.]MBS7007291.1 DNA/RNA non-specific endonuclease [Anaerostipes sp.]